MRVFVYVCGWVCALGLRERTLLKCSCSIISVCHLQSKCMSTRVFVYVSGKKCSSCVGESVSMYECLCACSQHCGVQMDGERHHVRATGEGSNHAVLHRTILENYWRRSKRDVKKKERYALVR